MHLTPWLVGSVGRKRTKRNKDNKNKKKGKIKKSDYRWNVAERRSSFYYNHFILSVGRPLSQNLVVLNICFVLV